MTVSLGNHPRYLEELRIGGGYGSNPDGGADFDKAGNIAANGSLDLDGPAVLGGDATVGGDFAITGVDTTWSTYLPASLGMPDPVLACGPVTPVVWRNYHVATPTMAFDPDNPKAAYFQFRLPPTYDGRALTFTIEWAATTGTSGDVRWGVNPISFGDGKSLIQTDSLNYVYDSFISTDTLHAIMVTASLPASANGRLVTVRILRHASDSGDTFDSEVLLLGMSIDY